MNTQCLISHQSQGPTPARQLDLSPASHRATPYRVLRSLLVASASCAALCGAVGQGAPETPRIRGTVVSLTDTTLTIVARDGKTMQLPTDLKTPVQYSVRMDFATLMPGVTVGSTAMADPAGNLTALEVHMFNAGTGSPPPSQRESDLKPGSILSTGTLVEVDTALHHRRLKLHVGAKDVVISVLDDTPTVTYAPADRSAVQPGTKVYLHVRRIEGGGFATGSITVGKDGIAPPL